MSSQQTTIDVPGDESGERRRSAVRVLYGATAAVVLSAFLPWVSVAGIISAHLSGGGLLLVLGCGAGYGGSAYLAAGATRRSVGIAWTVNALLGAVIVALYANLSGTEGVAGPAIGVFVAALGVCLGVVGAVKLSRAALEGGRS